MCSADEEARRTLKGRETDLDTCDVRMRSAQEILTAADQRDLTTDAGDAAARQREAVLDGAEFLGAEGEYGGALV